ncbi:carotenoid biosynthesis protein [Croceitalea sp. MTPC5]|uniref:carotenoid biosynthesis protein n=1 Tax=Croceitalea sp. MTPC5 TaxID=3056565 RepID=UPI0030D1F273
MIWLFHISGVIGIYFGNQDWFITKSPLNLTVSLLIFIWLFPLKTKKQWSLFAIFFFIGMFSEWLGVNYGILFGDYNYGRNLGPKFDGVPFLIGTYWALLTFITAEVSKKIGFSKRLKIVVAAALMVGLDFLMEKNAPVFDFWEFKGAVPIDNYLAWFGIGLLLQTILHKARTKGNKAIAIHLYFAQLLFFAFFYLFPLH